MRVKPGATIDGCSGEILKAAILIEPLFKNAGVELVITSGTRETHRADRSGHYRGDALDLRTRDLPYQSAKVKLVKAIKRKLGSAYVVILESNHIHLHWSPTLETAI